jgi:hypothetical protein
VCAPASKPLHTCAAQSPACALPVGGAGPCNSCAQGSSSMLAYWLPVDNLFIVSESSAHASAFCCTHCKQKLLHGCERGRAPALRTTAGAGLGSRVRCAARAVLLVVRLFGGTGACCAGECCEAGEEVAGPHPQSNRGLHLTSARQLYRVLPHLPHPLHRGLPASSSEGTASGRSQAMIRVAGFHLPNLAPSDSTHYAALSTIRRSAGLLSRYKVDRKKRWLHPHAS